MNRNLITVLRELGLVVLFVITFAIIWILVPAFGSSRNMIGLLNLVSTSGLVAGSMMLCLASRDFDLSVGSNVAFCGMMVVIGTNLTHSILLGIVMALICGSIVGVFNGVLIAKLKINALIATLATMQIIRSFAYISGNGRAIGVSDEGFNVIGLTKFSFLPSPFDQVPLPIWVTLLSFIVFGFILNRTVFGRNVLAIGGNPDASRLAGVNVEWTRIAIFTIQGLMCAIAGVLSASRITSGQPGSSIGLELTVISACVLGGVSLAGGRATISGVIVGVLILGMAQNVMDLLGIQSFYQMFVLGMILLTAVLFDNILAGAYRRR
ncbi:L-arabinose ABC transporter permease AraH [Labrys miyagiensis]|uniref:L-arabinose ABC transporter permease AraH n=1 Tax=Labrys miyagiensis TaxID=346912 RepID=A0ABQ6CLA6_9HYPH|nr:L-arabinose ABC transporter permease AraH [Labrys miyagiensis]GLS21076.1 L-arabinose ABC transporter permease AraH [Labrys miyagiensis]